MILLHVIFKNSLSLAVAGQASTVILLLPMLLLPMLLLPMLLLPMLLLSILLL